MIILFFQALIFAGPRIQPEDLVYLGAFRLPDGPEDIGWAYSGQALTYYPEGDPEGQDVFSGSLFGTGHRWNTYVSEISIPVPVISLNKNLDELNMAVTLQSFQNIRPAYFDTVYLEQTRAGLAYLSPQGSQITGKLYYCFAAHAGQMDAKPVHGWCEQNLSDSRQAGPWYMEDYRNYLTADYIFDIPESWAGLYTPGMRLATGRFRDGGQVSKGPTIFAYGPWNEGNPPEQGSTIACTPLLVYGDVDTENSPALHNYHHSDAWDGSVWLTAGDKSAVIFTGTKGRGQCWYGLIDGTVWEPPYPNDKPDSLLETRGWWSEMLTGQMIFFDTDDLAAVARGEMALWEPQPYDSLDLDPYLYHIQSERQKMHVQACAFDREHGYLYVMEPEVDDYKSLIHVWQVQGEETDVHRSTSDVQGFQLLQTYPNPFNRQSVIRYRISRACRIKVRIFDVSGRKKLDIRLGKQTVGLHQYTIDTAQWESGVYPVSYTHLTLPTN